MLKYKILGWLGLAGVIIIAAALYWQQGPTPTPPNTPVNTALPTAALTVPLATSDELRDNTSDVSAANQSSGITPPQSPAIEVVADNLVIPWEIAFLHDGRLLVTERPGRLLLIGQNRVVIPVEGVRHAGEGGLLGLALHPDFTNNNLLYLFLTAQSAAGPVNRVVNYRLAGNSLTDRTIIIDNIPGSNLHDGGRIAFSPDGFLYIATGDAGREANAQDINNLAGKILRLKDDGSIPDNNPFQNAVYSYGHRNPQGLTWDKAGRLWATEHGRSGVLSGFDEINLIEPGKNYGWPTIQGDESRSGLEPPRWQSGATTTWAPSGAVVYDNRLFFAGLRGEAIYEAALSGSTITAVKAHFKNKFGRLRTITVGPYGWLYILTNNRDGRGSPQDNDDKIIRINPELLNQ